VRVLQPEGWPRPRGFAHGVVAEGRMVFVAGMIGWDAAGEFAGDDLPAQVRQALANVLAVLAEAGGGPEHVARLTWYVTDRDEYNAAQKEIGAAYRELMGRHFPAMAVVEVSGLVEARAKVEIDATAVL
jgi:enamine deaminase RidA (YjgF/YER057c/UK114 family)